MASWTARSIRSSRGPEVDAVGREYRPLQFWRAFYTELCYLQQHAFPLARSAAVFAPLLRHLALQEHYDLIPWVRAIRGLGIVGA